MDLTDPTLQNYKGPHSLLSTLRGDNVPSECPLNVHGFCHMKEDRAQCLRGLPESSQPEHLSKAAFIESESGAFPRPSSLGV